MISGRHFEGWGGLRISIGSAPRRRSIAPPDGSWPMIDVSPVPESKTVKNRLHIDLRPDDQEAEVERLVDMGARPVDIGQHDVTWVVLADPEGNEFCVLSSRKTSDQ